MSLIRHPIIQYAYVVEDIDAAIHKWNRVFGAGPFLKIEHWGPADKHLYRGQPIRDDVTHAHGQCGPAQIQFTQQHNDAPSIWRDMYPKGSEGFHHVAVLVDDFDEEKARFIQMGCSVGEEFQFNTSHAGHVHVPAGTKIPEIGRCAYMDARHLIGCFVEVFEEHPIVRHEFNAVKAAHENWDGVTDLIRYSI